MVHLREKHPDILMSSIPPRGRGHCKLTESFSARLDRVPCSRVTPSDISFPTSPWGVHHYDLHLRKGKLRLRENGAAEMTPMVSGGAAWTQCETRGVRVPSHRALCAPLPAPSLPRLRSVYSREHGALFTQKAELA